MSMYYAYFFIAGILFGSACHAPGHVSQPEVSTYFQPVQLGDTLHLEVAAQADTSITGKPVPNSLFFTTMPAGLLQEIDYLADSASALVVGRQRFRLDDNLEAYWVEIRQSWFQHQSLFLYNRKKQLFTDRITVAEWYGGEGGQRLTGSWLVDYDGDGHKDLIRREIEHGMQLQGEEVQETIDETATLFLWKNGRFVETATRDSLQLLQRFPIRSFW